MLLVVFTFDLNPAPQPSGSWSVSHTQIFAAWVLVTGYTSPKLQHWSCRVRVGAEICERRIKHHTEVVANFLNEPDTLLHFVLSVIIDFSKIED